MQLSHYQVEPARMDNPVGAVNERQRRLPHGCHIGLQRYQGEAAIAAEGKPRIDLATTPAPTDVRLAP